MRPHAMMLLAHYAASTNRAKWDVDVFARGTPHNQSIQRCRLMAVAIATGFVESKGNEVVSKRFCKKQQMQWSKEGAHLLLQTRVRTLNGELSAIFKR